MAGAGRGGLQRQRQDREERTNPFKLPKLSCSSTGHVWLQRMNFDGKRESCGMIEVEMDGVHVCVHTHEYTCVRVCARALL